MIRSLLGHLFDFVYWVAAIAGLVMLSPGIENGPLWILILSAYMAVVVGVYFLVIRRIKRP